MTATARPVGFGLLEELLARPVWHQRAACRGRGDIDWLSGHRRDVRAARQVCAVCPVRAECLAAVLDYGPLTVGVWAGTTQRTRARRPPAGM